jgi:leucyl aminopeptidase (aminopeptidase T)
VLAPGLHAGQMIQQTATGSVWLIRHAGARYTCRLEEPAMVEKLKLGFAAVLIAAVVGPSAAQPKKELPPATPDYAALADRIIGKSANIKEGDVVQINGGPADVAFMEELAVAVRKRGAFPLMTLDSESFTKKLLAQQPPKYDAQSPTLELGLAKLINVRITIPAVRDDSVFAAFPGDRLAAIGKAYAPVVEAVRKHNVRLVDLDNGLAPSPSRAKALGISEAEMTKLYWDGLGADYSVVEAKAKALKDTLAAGTELHITAPNGTDFKIKVKGRKAIASDGVLSDDELKAGGPGINLWLPAGEVFLVPVSGSGDGKIVDDHMTFNGAEVQGITLDVKGGKITNITAKSGWDAVKSRWDAAGPGKTEIDLLDFGINPAVRSGGKLETWMGAGMIAISAGGNAGFGGTNKEPFAISFQMAGTTVTLDGKPLIETGVLK